MTDYREEFVKFLVTRGAQEPGPPLTQDQVVRITEMVNQVPLDSSFWDLFLDLHNADPMPRWASMLVVAHTRLERRVSQLLHSLDVDTKRSFGRNLKRLKTELPAAFGPAHAHGSDSVEVMRVARNSIAHGLEQYDDILVRMQTFAVEEIESGRASPEEGPFNEPVGLTMWLASRAIGWVARCQDHVDGVFHFE